NAMTSYIMNGAVNGYGDRVSAYKLNRFNPTDVMYFELDDDSDVDVRYWNDAASHPWEVAEAIGKRHINKTVLGFFDGHMEYIKTTEYYGMKDEAPGPLWCNPGSPTGGNSDNWSP
ncbi:MAG: hypothetical protein MJH11_21145, partial [Lentisphaeria bacterium]|nr:hypothetical protein [Lentisphaeria bacterium]